MKSRIKYFLLMALLVGVIIPGGPVLIIVSMLLISGGTLIEIDGTVFSLLAGIIGVALLFLSPALWKRIKPLRPNTLGQNLAPLFAVFAWNILAWVVPFALSGFSRSSFEEVTVWLTAPSSLVNLFVELNINMGGGFYWYLVIHFICFFITSAITVSFLPNSSQQDLWNKGSIWLITGTVALSALFIWEEIVYRAEVLAEDNSVSKVGDEVDLLEYLPQYGGNKLETLEVEPTLTIDSNYPRIDGATAGLPVYGAVAKALYRGISWQSEAEQLAGTVQCSTTPMAYERLIKGETDIIFAAEPSKGQQERAQAASVTLQQTPIAREAFVFVVNAQNPVDSLTIKQIQQIYQKQITNWKDVGGENQSIMPFQRPQDSGSQTIMLAKVMQGKSMTIPLKEESIYAMGGLISEVAKYRNYTEAIGYSFRWYATGMKHDPSIKLLAVDGVAPTALNIKNGSYPFTIDVYAVTAGTKNPNVPKLIDWILSNQGQEFIEKIGYVGVGE